MKEEQIAEQKTIFESWVRQYGIYAYIESAEEVSKHDEKLVWTEYDDLSSSFYLCQGCDTDTTRRLPVLGWYLGQVPWEGDRLTFIDVNTAVSLDCLSCRGSGEKTNGDECSKCEGEGGRLIEFSIQS